MEKDDCIFELYKILIGLSDNMLDTDDETILGAASSTGWEAPYDRSKEYLDKDEQFHKMSYAEKLMVDAVYLYNAFVDIKDKVL